MVNVTISVPEALKSRMDRHPNINWSRVCREAIDARIRLLENPVPDIKMELDEIKFGYDRGIPGLRLDLTFRNEMNAQLVLDRMFFEVNFQPTPGVTLDIASSTEMRKRIIPKGKSVMIPIVGLDPNSIFRIDEQLSRTFQCGVHITGFFDRFAEAYTRSLAAKVPIDEWQEFVKLVLRDEKEKEKIRETRLREITGQDQ